MGIKDQFEEKAQELRNRAKEEGRERGQQRPARPQRRPESPQSPQPPESPARRRPDDRRRTPDPAA
ncbi:hypothetical protein ACWF94_17700 [Streptomyces sp. NPDC055078]